MIAGHWKRIAGLHAADDGDIALVWMALDKDTDTIHLYDSAIFRREVLLIIAEGINARGRFPIAWGKESQAIADQLLARGCNMLPYPYNETSAIRETTSRDIWERMRSSRFKVDKRLSEWQDEYRTFYRDDSQVPEGFPLMAATRHAVANLEWARPQQKKRRAQKNYPRMAIV